MPSRRVAFSAQSQAGLTPSHQDGGSVRALVTTSKKKTAG